MKLIEWFSEHRKSPALLAAVAAVAILVLALALGISQKRDVAVARERLADAKYPVEPLVATLRALWMVPADMQPEIEKRLRFELAALRQPIERATPGEPFRKIDRLLAQIERIAPASLSKTLEGLKAYRAEKEEAADYRALEELVARGGVYAEAARAFVQRYPKSQHLARVQGWQSRAAAKAESKDRGEIDAFKVGSKDDVDRKLALMDAYVQRYPHAADTPDMKRAAEVARRVLALTSVKVVVAGAGTFNGTREFSVKLAVDGGQVAEVLAPGAVKEATWDGELSLPWSPGKPFSLVLYDYTWRNEDAATLAQAGIWGPFALAGRRTLEPVGSWEPYFEGKPWVELKTPEVAPEEWTLLATYFPESADGF